MLCLFKEWTNFTAFSPIYINFIVTAFPAWPPASVRRYRNRRHQSSMESSNPTKDNFAVTAAIFNLCYAGNIKQMVSTVGPARQGFRTYPDELAVALPTPP
jgi:hypothetical protein